MYRDSYIFEIELSLTSYVGIRVECRLYAISKAPNVHLEQ